MPDGEFFLWFFAFKSFFGFLVGWVDFLLQKFNRREVVYDSPLVRAVVDNTAHGRTGTTSSGRDLVITETCKHLEHLAFALPCFGSNADVDTFTSKSGERSFTCGTSCEEAVFRIVERNAL